MVRVLGFQSVRVAVRVLIDNYGNQRIFLFLIEFNNILVELLLASAVRENRKDTPLLSYIFAMQHNWRIRVVGKVLLFDSQQRRLEIRNIGVKRNDQAQ